MTSPEPVARWIRFRGESSPTSAATRAPVSTQDATQGTTPWRHHHFRPAGSQRGSESHRGARCDIRQFGPQGWLVPAAVWCLTRVCLRMLDGAAMGPDGDGCVLRSRRGCGGGVLGPASGLAPPERYRIYACSGSHRVSGAQSRDHRIPSPAKGCCFVPPLRGPSQAAAVKVSARVTTELVGDAEQRCTRTNALPTADLADGDRRESPILQYVADAKPPDAYLWRHFGSVAMAIGGSLCTPSG